MPLCPGVLRELAQRHLVACLLGGSIHSTVLRDLFAIAAVAIAVALHAQCISTFPATENFTGGTVGTPGTLITGWSNLSGDDLNWFVDNNGTPTANTGPIGDHTSNNTLGKCMYAVCTGATATPTNVAILKSNCYTVHPDQP
jgi:hypothetical protein